MIQLIADHKGVAALALWILFSNAVAALPTMDDFKTCPGRELIYGWFLKFTTGVMQMIPKPGPRAPQPPLNMEGK